MLPALHFWGGPSAGSQDTDQTSDLATLAEQDAYRLAGRRVTFRLALDSDPGEEDGHTLYDCRTGDTGDAVLRTVRFDPGQDAEDLQGEHTVEGILQVLRHAMK